MNVNVGVIGIGGLGHLQANTLLDMEGVGIGGAADVSAEARSLFEDEFDAPAYSDYRELLYEQGDELDAVTIVTPHTLHYEQAKACLERGIHVLVEKPMVTDVDHALDLVETANEQGIVLQVGYQRHFHPAFEEIRRLRQTGRLGQVHTVNCYLGQDWIDLHRDSWRTDPSLSGGGQLYDTGSHLLDALLWTTESRPKTVTAQIEFDEPEVDVNSALALTLDHDEGRITGAVSISGNGMEISPSEGYFFWGTEGRLSYHGERIAVAEKDARTYWTEVSGGTDFQSLNRQKLQNFIQSIEGVAEPAVPGEVGLQVTALTEAAYRAADTGGAVEVQSLIEEGYATLD